jgi:D-glycero-D-manno-heptose 1,7-bisphosphate phosphatase
MCEVFCKAGIEISKVYFCPFHPEHGLGDYKKDSYFRKPSPGMILEAINEFNIDVSNSVLIGNKITDIQAGIAAGLETNILYDDCLTNFSNQSDTNILISNLSQAKLLL